MTKPRARTVTYGHSWEDVTACLTPDLLGWRAPGGRVLHSIQDCYDWFNARARNTKAPPPRMSVVQAMQVTQATRCKTHGMYRLPGWDCSITTDEMIQHATVMLRRLEASHVQN